MCRRCIRDKDSQKEGWREREEDMERGGGRGRGSGEEERSRDLTKLLNVSGFFVISFLLDKMENRPIKSS